MLEDNVCLPSNGKLYTKVINWVQRSIWVYAEYIMRNAGLEETQAGIKIARRNINYLRYADDTTLIAEK